MTRPGNLAAESGSSILTTGQVPERAVESKNESNDKNTFVFSRSQKISTYDNPTLEHLCKSLLYSARADDSTAISVSVCSRHDYYFSVPFL
jgi:hypothetical protein